MNKKIFLFPVASLLLLAGCRADEQPDAGGLVPLSLSATVEDDAGAATRAGTAVNNSFASGDAFYAYFPSDVRVGSTTSASNTTFSYNGSAWSPGTQPYFNAGTTSATVHAYYGKSGGSSGTQVTNSTTSFSVATDQSGDANYKASDLMYATTTVQKSSPTASLSFSHRMSKILVTANIGAGITNIQSVKIVGGYRTINISTPQSCTLGTSLSDANSSTNITMWSGTSTSAVNCAALIPPQTINGNFLQIVTDKGTATYSLSSKQFETGKSYQLTITVNAAAIGTTVAITGWTGTGNATVNPSVEVYRQAVDLGLPSGTKWANMNVGASSPTDYGMYFMWGDVAGHPGVKDGNDNATDGFSFDWANYKWTTDNGSSFTKYTGSDYTTLQSADDAATANWGSPWRMPTAAELAELYRTNPNYNPDYDFYSDAGSKTKIDGYTWTWCDGSDTQYMGSSVAGYIITNTSSNAHIFLPAAGYRYATYVYYQGSDGFFWSSTLYSDYPLFAWYLYFDSGSADVSHDYRYDGFTVRPVQ